MIAGRFPFNCRSRVRLDAGLYETLAPGCFTWGDDLVATLDHSPDQVIASLRDKTLRIRQDDEALHFEIDTILYVHGASFRAWLDRWEDGDNVRVIRAAELEHIALLLDDDGAYHVPLLIDGLRPERFNQRRMKDAFRISN